MTEDNQNTNPPVENPRVKESRLLSWLKGLLAIILLVVVVVASFWVSFQLGKRVLLPVKKFPEKKIQATIPEAPPSIKALQDAVSKEVAKDEATKLAPPPVVKQATRKITKQVPAPVKRVASGKYYKVQTAFFDGKEEADQLAKNLKESGYQVYLKNENGRWGVQLGAFRKEGQAQVQEKDLQEKGFNVQIVYN